MAALALLLTPLAGLSAFTGTYVASRLLGIALTDPFAGMEALLASRGAAAALAVSLLLVVLAYLLLGRAFCAWVCPLGLVLEGVDWVRERLLQPAWRAVARRWVGAGRPARLPEWCPPRWVRFAAAGGLLAASLVLGLPLFEIVSPQAGLMRALLFGAGIQLWFLAAAAVVDLAVARRGWCRYLCPAGAAFSLLSRAGFLRVLLADSGCTRCGDCLAVCPMGPATLRAAVAGRGEPWADPLTCTACGACVEACTRQGLRFAWYWPWQRRGTAFNRRRLLRGAAGAAGAAAAGALAWHARPVLAGADRMRLRPPGALAEAEFLARCLRCGQCAQACHRGAIVVAGLEAGLAGVGTPYIEPRLVSCDLCGQAPSLPCAAGCPGGALRPTGAEREQMGVAEVDTTCCLTWSGIICRSCYAVCTRQDQGLYLTLSQQGGIWSPLVDPGGCAGCGMCEHVCPQDPPAIRVRPVNPDAAGSEGR